MDRSWSWGLAVERGVVWGGAILSEENTYRRKKSRWTTGRRHFTGVTLHPGQGCGSRRVI